MEVMSVAIPEIKLVTPRIFRDQRGFFSETFNARAFAAANISAQFVQDNHCYSSHKGVVRGLHLQIPPHAQDKLVRVIRGSIFDVAVDLRAGSPSYSRHVSTVLGAADCRQVWIPRGFAHGYCTLEPDTEVIYKVTTYHEPAFERGLLWNDAALAIDWPIAANAAIVAERDSHLPQLAEIPTWFEYEPGAAA
jgi:dTDP-4-dehydrorhamnose 3,5-epimerase